MRRDVLVLGYHAVSWTWPDSLALRPDRLAEQLAWLLQRGYRGVTLSQALLGEAIGKTFAVTFDDGFRSVLVEGLPVLASHGIPGTIFPSVRYIDSERPPVGPALRHWLGGPYEDELMGLSWEDLRHLLDAGWEVGSHTISHPYLTELDDDALDWELQGSRDRFERELGRPCLTLAYPSGDHDARVVAAARRSGYAVACTLPRRFPSRPELHAWPRVSVSRGDDLRTFRIKTSRTTRRLRTMPFWTALDTGRRRISARRVPTN